MSKSKELPVIARQLDTDVYLTTDGDRISVQEYEARKQKLEDGQEAPAASDGEHLPRNAEAEKQPSGDTARDGLEAEVHQSATKAGENHGQLVRNDDKEVEVPEEGTTTEETPAVAVVNTVESVEDADGSNVSVDKADAEEEAPVAEEVVEAPKAEKPAKKSAK